MQFYIAFDSFHSVTHYSYEMIYMDAAMKTYLNYRFCILNWQNFWYHVKYSVSSDYISCLKIVRYLK